MTHYAGRKSSSPNFDRPGKNNWRRKPECFCLCFKITSTEFFPTPVWFYKSPQGVQKNYANKCSPPIFKEYLRKWGGIKLPRRVDFLPANVSKPRQRFFDSVVPFNLLLVECKTTRFGQMLLFFFTLTMQKFSPKMTHYAGRKSSSPNFDNSPIKYQSTTVV